MSETVPTGLAGLSVTATETSPSPPVFNPPAPPAPTAKIPMGWTVQRVGALVRDVAANLYDTDVILKTHGLTEAQYATLSVNEFFKKALEAETVVWHAPNNAQKRLALQSAIALEDTLPDVVARMKDRNAPLAAVASLVKILSEIVGLTGATVPQQGPSADRIKITINLGGDIAAFEKTPAPVEVQSQPEGAGADVSLQQLANASGG